MQQRSLLCCPVGTVVWTKWNLGPAPGVWLVIIDQFASLKLIGLSPRGDLDSRTHEYSTTARTILQAWRHELCGGGPPLWLQPRCRWATGAIRVGDEAA
jgi:hypothetical protein